MRKYNATDFAKLFDHASDEMIAAFVAAANRIKNRARLLELVAAIESSDADGVMAILGIDPSQWVSLDDEMSGAYKAAADLELRYQQSAINREIKIVEKAEKAEKKTEAEQHAEENERRVRYMETESDPLLRSFEPEKPLTRVQINFNVRNPRAERYLREQAGSMIVEISEGQREMINAFLSEQMERGMNPRDAVNMLVGKVNKISGRRDGGMIGLTTAQMEWVFNARDELQAGRYGEFLQRNLRDKISDKSIRVAMRDGKKLTQEQIDKIIIRYQNNLLKMRAETIARTEMLEAMNAAKYEAALQAMEAAGVEPEYLIREWSTSSDARVRETHREMHGQQVIGITTPFETPDGHFLLYPGDRSLGAPAEETIQCRCMALHRVDYVRMWKDRKNGKR